MTPEEYAATYWEPRYQHEAFIAQFTTEFAEHLAALAPEGWMPYPAFRKEVAALREKYKAITVAAKGRLRKSTWKYIYAAFIIPMMEKYCPEEVLRRAMCESERLLQQLNDDNINI